MHSMVGVLALLLYVLHVDHWWPDSGYVQLLAALMLAVTITGFIGYLIEKIYPRRLTHKGDDILFETIPDACYQIRMEVENLLFTQIRETGSDTLSRHYMESMDWYFQRPRFIWSHLSGGRKADYWLKQQFATVNRYLNQAELEYSQQLEILANKKQGLDYQYTVQGIIKLWLLVHVPLSVMLLVMSLWHLLLVNIYSA
jgi:branched-subunit amino acid ABC-type transport system permease component